MTRKAKPKAKPKRKPTNSHGKDASPRGGEKAKQTRVTETAGMSESGQRQTKLSFAPASIAVNAPPTPTNPVEMTTITPEASRLPPLPESPKASDTEMPMTRTAEKQQKKKKPPKAKTTFSLPNDNETTNKEPNTPKSSNTAPSKVTYAEATQNNESAPEEEPNQTSNDEKKRAAKNSKKHKNSKKTTGTEEATLGEYTAIRYRGIIEAPPSTKPVQDFVLLLKKYIKTVQDILGKKIYLSPWDKTQEATFPLIKIPEDVPESRESLGVYLGTYINPKEDGGNLYLNLRWVTYATPPVALDRFGMEVSDALRKHKMSMNKQPFACQAVKSCCIGWFMYSTKHINSTAFITETRLALGIPITVPIGISYRSIVNEFGKKPPFNREDPPAAAIHLDIDEKFQMVYQQKAASLWRKNSRKRLPNGVQLRLVPCFSSPIGKSMPDEIRADAKTLAERQYFFVKEHIRTIDYHFISLLDTPISTSNTMTLRRAMMARAPKDKPLSRLIHNVDQSWNQASKYIVTTVVGKEEEANRFLANLIPELLHDHGPESSKWFTSQGLSVYNDVRWNPKKGTTSSTNAKESAAMVEEDLWDLGDKWKKIKTTTADERPDTTTLDGKGKETDEITGKKAKQKKAPHDFSAQMNERLAGDKSVASFGAAFGRTQDSDDEKEAELNAFELSENPPDNTGTQFIFNPEQLARENERAALGYEADDKSMSTAGKTTDSTRLKLKMAQEQIEELQIALRGVKNPKALDETKLLSSSEIHDLPFPGPDTMEESNNPTTMEIEAEPTDAQDTMEESNDPTTMEIEAEPTDAQVIGYAIHRKQEAIHPDEDAMEDQEHLIIGIGSDAPSDSTASYSSPSDPSSSSNSSSSNSSSSSSSSSGTHDTAELVSKLSNNPYHPISKSMTKIGNKLPSSKSDTESIQSSGQDSGSSKGHTPEVPSGKAGIASDAGEGD